ncbi:hypothetical protein BVX97_04730 [bacterium E08(2017)]|nr:hypothetical protein BVX97_04730 [bacterium E08(2017)]
MKTIHIIVEAGDDKGKQIHVPKEGARLGRSSKNDVVLVDPLLSRHHCRFYFKPGEGMFVTDLGSSNKTMVNGVEIFEQQVKTGDTVQVGDTIMKVVNDGVTQESKPSVVDLGLSPALNAPAASAGRKSLGKGPLIVLAAVMAALVAGVYIYKMMSTDKPEETSTTPARKEIKTLDIEYEKVEADTSNIFRYKMLLTPDNQISIEIDDVINNRTVRKEKEVDPELVDNLIRFIEKSDFFKLNNDYKGVQPGVHNLRELSITINKKTHTVTVLNRPEPEVFSDVRDKIEVFGKNELGLWAIQFSTEKLIEMAENEYLTAKKLYDDRDVKYGNLSQAIVSFQRAEVDLETVEPKPSFYADTISSLRKAKEELDNMHQNLSFEAERCIKLEQWALAADNLRVIQEMIPDRSDDRNKNARKLLLDVEERINNENR